MRQGAKLLTLVSLVISGTALAIGEVCKPDQLASWLGFFAPVLISAVAWSISATREKSARKVLTAAS